jgi:hypothetical protein
MWPRAILFSSIAALACSAFEKDPSFEIRNFALKTDETSYATSFIYSGTVLTHGDDNVAKRLYMVAVEYKYLGGGDPELPHDSTQIQFVTVMNGAGDIAVAAGYRPKEANLQKGATWPPERYSARVIGFVPIISAH